MKLSVDRDLPVPLGVQLRGLIEYGIACGELLPGARLPSVRELADELKVAPMTVSQVYRELKVGGLIEARSGLAFQLVEGIALLSKVDWRAKGLDGLGRPDGFHDSDTSVPLNEGSPTSSTRAGRTGRPCAAASGLAWPSIGQ